MRPWSPAYTLISTGGGCWASKCWTLCRDIILVLLLGAIAAPVAAFLCHKVPERLLGLLIGATLAALNLRTLLSAVMR